MLIVVRWSAVVDESTNMSACTSSADHTAQYTGSSHQPVISTTTNTTSAFKRATTSPPSERNDASVMSAYGLPTIGIISCFSFVVSVNLTNKKLSDAIRALWFPVSVPYLWPYLASFPMYNERFVENRVGHVTQATALWGQFFMSNLTLMSKSVNM